MTGAHQTRSDHHRSTHRAVAAMRDNHSNEAEIHATHAWQLRLYQYHPRGRYETDGLGQVVGRIGDEITFVFYLNTQDRREGSPLQVYGAAHIDRWQMVAMVKPDLQIDGRPVRRVFRDDGDDPDAALRAAEEWLAQQYARVPQRQKPRVRAVIATAPADKPRMFVHDQTEAA